MPDELDQWIAAALGPFAGWDFSLLTRTGRMAETPLPWSYGSIVLPPLWRSEALLDMGTGGGEALASLRPLPRRVVATEGYPPNVPVASARLEPLGVEVVPVGEGGHLPFPDGTFDLVLNRHEYYDPAEVRRVLSSGGHFITQQVDGQSETRLNDLFDVTYDAPWAEWRLASAAHDVAAAGLRVTDQREAEMETRFYDLGALIFYLGAVPWQIQDFDPLAHRAGLAAALDEIHQRGYLAVPGRRFLLSATRD